MFDNSKSQQGFTLVELSIVIVIIGLIVAGVTAGQSLVRQAKLNRIITDVNKYKVAINTFKLQYNYFPGDMPNAQSYWPACADSGGNTCNGNGNKLLNAWPLFEDIRFWQHLNLAGLIEGSYSGVLDGSGNRDVPGINAPAGPLSQSTYPIYSGSTYYNKDANSIQFSKATWTCNDFATDAILSAQEAYALDKKIDDGLADKGILYSIKAAGSGCAYYPGCVANDLTSPTSGAYDFSLNTPQCSLIFWF